MVRSLLKLSLKLLNSAIGMGGIAVIVYGVQMIRVWRPDEDHYSSSSYHSTIPWFFRAFLGVGVILCAITCLGYVAANTGNICCLSWYISSVLLLLIFETIVIASLFINHQWQKDLPKDLFERLDKFKDFVHSNDGIWKCTAWFIFMVQGICVLLACILRTLETGEVDGPHRADEDEDIVQTRFPLLGPSGRQISNTV